MSTYKTTEQGVRDCYSLNSGTYAFSPERAARFDHWLAEMKAEAWLAGAKAGYVTKHSNTAPIFVNPYRGEQNA